MSDPRSEAKIGNVLYPVGDVAAAVDFYEGVFRFERKFVDGDRYAAVNAGDTTLAIAGPEEHMSDGPAASFKVPDVAAALDALRERGGRVLRDAEAGPHEVRAVAQDPWGNVLVVYGPK